MDSLLLILLVLAVVCLLVVLYKYTSLRSQLEARAREHYEIWRDRELATLQKQYGDVARQEAEVRFHQWRQESEGTIRKDAIEKSRAVTLGKVTEHIVPFLPDFQYNPKDARFLGSPVDFVIFDGLSEGAVRKIVFMEVKTGASTLTTRERQIRDIVARRSVEWEEVRVPHALSRSD